MTESFCPPAWILKQREKFQGKLISGAYEKKAKWRLQYTYTFSELHHIIVLSTYILNNKTIYTCKTSTITNPMRTTLTCGYFVKSPDQKVFSVPPFWSQNSSPAWVFFRKKCPQVSPGRQQVFMILWLCSLTNASIMINRRKLCPPYQKSWTKKKESF